MTCLSGVSARHFEAVGLRTLSLIIDSMIDLSVPALSGQYAQLAATAPVIALG